jgi:hypothetical protein
LRPDYLWQRGARYSFWGTFDCGKKCGNPNLLILKGKGLLGGIHVSQRRKKSILFIINNMHKTFRLGVVFAGLLAYEFQWHLLAEFCTNLRQCWKV